ncbi:MAG: type II toxin-antitoxin system RelE/ParE family toxin [Methylococcaceae bacterium]|nr:type II toxin-antitoxin system RelE/ParE family toxin [Methylococcaceae bacterium]
MSQVIITDSAARGLERCRRFLATHNSNASKRAAKVIRQHLAVLEKNPEIGRFFENHEFLKELIIPFGDSGYVALYEYDVQADIVYILSFRHQKEAGY